MMSERIIEQYVLPLSTTKDTLQDALFDYQMIVGYDIVVREQAGGIVVTRFDNDALFSSALDPHNPQHKDAIGKKYPGFQKDHLKIILMEHELEPKSVDF